MNEGTIGGNSVAGLSGYVPMGPAGAVLALSGTVTLTGGGMLVNNTIDSAAAGAVLVNADNTITMNTITLTGTFGGFTINTTAPTGVFDVGVTNEAAGIVSGGTFELGVVNDGAIANAIFRNAGTSVFDDVIDQTGDGTISGGTFFGGLIPWPEMRH